MRTELLLLLLVPATASAWNPAGRDWTWMGDPAVEFELNVDSFPAELDPAEVAAAWAAARDAWNEAGAEFEWLDGGTTTATSWVYDQTQISQHHDGAASGGTLAIANSWYSGDELVDCDVRFFAANDNGSIAWSADPAGSPSGAFDLQQVATHELGHCLGLGHSDVEAMMAPTVSSHAGPEDRALADDDIAGILSIYGAAVEPEPPVEEPPVEEPPVEEPPVEEPPVEEPPVEEPPVEEPPAEEPPAEEPPTEEPPAEEPPTEEPPADEPSPRDRDGDGLDDLAESHWRTNPSNPDTDGDGLLDGPEVDLGTDPLNPDTDGDLLADGDEVDAGTDPFDPDTDGDGLLDGREFTVGTDPLNPDTDGDGFDDNTEVLDGTDPLDPFDPVVSDDTTRPVRPAFPPSPARPEHPTTPPSSPAWDVGCSVVGGGPGFGLALLPLLPLFRRRQRLGSQIPRVAST